MISKKDIKMGMRISCKISGVNCPVAKLQIEDNRVFICQNYQAGDVCKDTLGFKNSWSVGYLSDLENDQSVNDFFMRTEVKNVLLLEIPEWNTDEN